MTLARLFRPSGTFEKKANYIKDSDEFNSPVGTIAYCQIRKTLDRELIGFTSSMGATVPWERQFHGSDSSMGATVP